MNIVEVHVQAITFINIDFINDQGCIFTLKLLTRNLRYYRLRKLMFFFCVLKPHLPTRQDVIGRREDDLIWAHM